MPRIASYSATYFLARLALRLRLWPNPRLDRASSDEERIFGIQDFIIIFGKVFPIYLFFFFIWVNFQSTNFLLN